MKQRETRIHLGAVLALVACATLLEWLLPTPRVDGVEPALAIFNLFGQLAILVISAIISYALTPKPPSPKPAALTDFEAPTAQEGRPVPVVFGECWLRGPNVLYYGNLSVTPIRKKGGKK